jgi:hypothetical protein
VGTQKRGGQLGYQLFGRVSLFIEAAFEIAIEARFVAGPVTVMPISA